MNKHCPSIDSSLTSCFEHPQPHTLFHSSDTCKKHRQIDHAAVLAHEIKNPLTTVKGFIQLLEPELIRMGKHQQAEILIEEIERATQLINTYLGTHKPEVAKKPVCLQKVGNDILAIFECEAAIRGISLTHSSLHEDLIVTANADQIKQVLINLIMNAYDAVEASGPGEDGLVTLKMYKIRDEVCIAVEDNGAGIGIKEQETLFLPFYTTKETGTGVGLSICKQIIEDHQGRIHVESTHGKGTTFFIFLPAFSNDDKQKEEV